MAKKRIFITNYEPAKDADGYYIYKGNPRSYCKMLSAYCYAKSEIDTAKSSRYWTREERNLWKEAEKKFMDRYVYVKKADRPEVIEATEEAKRAKFVKSVASNADKDFGNFKKDIVDVLKKYGFTSGTVTTENGEVRIVGRL